MSGCALYKKPEVPAVLEPTHFKYEVQATYAPLKERWWENFNDHTLNQLIELALKNNYDYQVALKNIEIAETYVTQNQSFLFPQINFEFDSSRNKTMSLFNTNEFISNADTSIADNNGSAGRGRVFNLQQIFSSVSYEVDVWNQLRNAVKQSKADVASSIAQSDVVKLTLLSNVANTYFQINALNSQLSNLKQQYQATKDLFYFNGAQYKGKLIDVTTVNDSSNQMDAIKINIKNAEKQREILMNMLAYLLGSPPEFLSFPGHDSLKHIDYAHIVPAGIPAKMMVNRPDIQSAYFNVLSTGYVEKQSLANFFPNINLTGNYGYANSSFSKIFTVSHAFWNYGASLLQPIFDYKLRMSEYKRSKYQYESSIITYKETIVNAFQEVDNALLSYQKDSESLYAYQNQVRNSTQKLNVSDAQYQSGYGEYSAYLTNKLTLLQNAYNVTAQQLAVTQDVIQVYKTLGLGLSFSPPTQKQPFETKKPSSLLAHKDAANTHTVSVNSHQDI
jgi:multidrug efflux system outer membrane protein